MNEATVAITIMSFLLFAIFLGFFVWAVKSGQFKNVEEAKYHVFKNERRATSAEKQTHIEAPQAVPPKKEEGV